MMMINRAYTKKVLASRAIRTGERGAALLLSLIILTLMSAIALTVLAVATPEVRVASSDLCRTQTFYATAAGIEKMTTDFSALFNRSSNPTTQQLNDIALAPPSELVTEGFSFNQSMVLDQTTLDEMRLEQGITNNSYPRVTIPSGPFAGLLATVAPYRLESTATSGVCKGDVKLERTINNYLIPLFQFGMFSNEDLELHPGPAFTFNGRVHANGNLYVNGNVTFLAKVTTGNELVREVVRNGVARNDPTVSMMCGTINVSMSKGSVNLGPNLPGATFGSRGYFPTSPNGSINTTWNSTSVAAPQTGVANKFGGQLLTRSTGGAQLLLPIQLDGNPTREIIKRAMPGDEQTLSESRYQNKAQIRILLDDETASANAAGIPITQGQPLSTFVPSPLPAGSTSSGGGRALWQINDAGAYITTSSTAVRQNNSSGTLVQADTVRAARAVMSLSPNNVRIPGGAGITGRIRIQIVSSTGVVRDVTREILSMGITEGEPNAIVHLQRPLWAAFLQGSRDATGGTNHLSYITTNTSIGADGEIKTSGAPNQDPTYFYLTNILEDTPTGQQPTRPDAPPVLVPASFTSAMWNSIVPINVYNVREGYINSALSSNTVYERGITSVVELNMRNLARWVDGVYDNNLLAGTQAVSGNIDGTDGYIVYISDRRGDKIKTERYPTGNVATTNGLVDNEDIYGPNGSLDPGEDVIDFGVDSATGIAKKGALQKDITELPDPAALAGTSGVTSANRIDRALKVAAWTNPSNYFRRAVRIYNGENLIVSGAANKLSDTKGITVATENMAYIWGSYNTTGINGQPTSGSTLNDPSLTYHYLGNQVPASIVADAIFPLSKTWFDAMTAANPDDLSKRTADALLPSLGAETSVRAGIIAGNNLSAMAGSPDAGNSSAGESRLNGGMHNFPRFLENWGTRWNFVGSLIPLYHSTQALGPYNANSTIYGAPIRNWAFDETFKDPSKLPPGTLSFQYIEPTGFRQLLY